MKQITLSFLIISILLVYGCNQGNESNQSDNTADNVESESDGYPENVYFGDTHLHTELSMDAGAFGNTIGLDEAYRFAKGEAVTSSTGVTAKLSRPLDLFVKN